MDDKPKELALNGQLNNYRRDSLDLSPTYSGNLLNISGGKNRTDSVDLSPTGDGHLFPFQSKKKKTRLRR